MWKFYSKKVFTKTKDITMYLAPHLRSDNDILTYQLTYIDIGSLFLSISDQTFLIVEWWYIIEWTLSFWNLTIFLSAAQCPGSLILRWNELGRDIVILQTSKKFTLRAPALQGVSSYKKWTAAASRGLSLRLVSIFSELKKY